MSLPVAAGFFYLDFPGSGGFLRWLGVGRSVPGHMALFVAILDAGLGRRGCALGCQAVPMGGQLANVLGVWLGWRLQWRQSSPPG